MIKYTQFVEYLDKKAEESEDFFAIAKRILWIIAGIWENREITAETLRQEAFAKKR